MTEIRKNRDNLISMMAICEDIYRTNHRILEMLRSIMNNPEMKNSIKESVKDLVVKAQKLENIDLDIPLFEEEKAVVPGPEDASPREDIEYEKLLQSKPDPEPELEEEVEPELEEEMEPVAEIPPQKPRRNARNTQPPRRNARKQRPNRPLGDGRRAPQPNEDNQ